MEMNHIKEQRSEDIDALEKYIYDIMKVEVKKEDVRNTAALKLAIETLAKRYGCRAAAIQCWNAMQDDLGLFPCVANALLADEVPCHL